MRSALTASVLAAGILLGGAGAALANDGGGLVQSSGAHLAERTHNASFAGVPAHIGPVYAATGDTETEWDHETFQGVFFGH